ncbi:SusE domain-containing protein [Puia dinghuensis]|uniref:SusE outer membrane protein domain-containing protein n=1 Tax=Puia dinghuensis TaxID=1792502 RepID=A0A8J2UE53_9BACT|nr:SusE domain-containing protein [Puia dinghuensis]GGB03843.1 hypothetical protein GCM10011511_28970 [Puia dinghuensis]
MKKLYIACLAVFMLAASCKKDITQPTLSSPSGISGFTVNNNTIVLSSANDSVEVAVFKWPALNYNVSTPVTYTLLIDQPADTSGASAWGNALKTTITTDSLNKSWLGTDFNKLCNQLGLTPGVASPVVVRLKADVNQSNGSKSTVPSLTSDVGLTVTTYKVILIYPKLYVAGDFLSPQWTQKDQPGWILASVKSDGVYEGYINFPNASNNFKLCTQLSWNGTNYGWGTSQTTISGSGSAGNCWFGQVAYARVVADVNALTISYTPTSWYIAGAFNNWSTTATPMTFNTSTNVWTATGVTMAAGGTFKFVSNSDWNNQYGLDAKGNLLLGNTSGNITSTKAGTFTVTLDLSQGAGNYAYSLK